MWQAQINAIEAKLFEIGLALNRLTDISTEEQKARIYEAEQTLYAFQSEGLFAIRKSFEAK
ncbi:MAG: hypothetical protein PHP01_06525 [Phycisphaerae bacterium]|nr:hypothetical protein [Phycisphaerae bacterium]